MFKRAAAILLLSFLGVSAANAATITYTEVATASGFLNNISFVNQTVTVTLVADTANVIGWGTPPSYYTNNGGPSFVTIGSGSAIPFTDTIMLYDSQIFNGTGIVGLIDATVGTEVLTTIANPFATYTASTAIGPVTGGLGAVLNRSYGTVSGALVFTSESANSTFTATVSPNSVAATPEPSSLALLSTGIVGVAGLMRRRLVRA